MGPHSTMVKAWSNEEPYGLFRWGSHGVWYLSDGYLSLRVSKLWSPRLQNSFTNNWSRTIIEIVLEIF